MLRYGYFHDAETRALLTPVKKLEEVQDARAQPRAQDCVWPRINPDDVAISRSTSARKCGVPEPQVTRAIRCDRGELAHGRA